MHWLTIDWWKYLCAKPARGTNRMVAFWCRMHGHPAGVEFYNPGGIEPNMHCRCCGDDLG